MKSLLIALFLSTAVFSSPTTNSPSLQLEKHYKIIGSFSGDIHQEDSFHIIIARNNKMKQYEIIPVSYKNNTLKRLPSVFYKKQPSIVSYHSVNEGVSIVTSFKDKKEELMQVVDINLETGALKASDSFSADNYKTAIRQEDKNYLIYSNKSNDLIVKVILNSNTIQELVVPMTKDNSAVLKGFDEESIDAINTNEYVKNGSISDIKAYLINESIVITREDSKARTTSILKFPANRKDTVEVAAKVIDYSAFKEVKKASTYIGDKSMYQVLLNKKEIKFNVIDLNSENTTAVDFKDSHINGPRDFAGLETFLKGAAKSSNQPTITVNTSVEGNAVVRMDYVSKNAYRYNYNWWWHHQFIWQQQMMWQQQQMMKNISVPTGFGPSLYMEDFYFKNKKKHHFEIVIGAENQILSGASTTTNLLKIDKEKHVKLLKDKRGVMHESSVFLGNKFRVFEYDKKVKAFKVSETVVND